MNSSRITTLFLDIGGVLLTNGWDTALRKKTAAQFQVPYEEVDSRHRLIYDTYEEGKLPLEEYLRQVFFFEPRTFTSQDVIDFILYQARPYEEMIDYIKKLKAVYHLRIAVVSNEGREIGFDRIQRFQLREFVDFFIVSAFVHLRKPDPDIYRLALDVAHVQPHEVAYIDDRKMLVENAALLGINSIQHKDVAATRAALAELGLTL